MSQPKIRTCSGFALSVHHLTVHLKERMVDVEDHWFEDLEADLFEKRNKGEIDVAQVLERHLRILEVQDPSAFAQECVSQIHF